MYIVTQEAAILAQRRIKHRKVVIIEEDIINALTVIPPKVARLDVTTLDCDMSLQPIGPLQNHRERALTLCWKLQNQVLGMEPYVPALQTYISRSREEMARQEEATKTLMDVLGAGEAGRGD